MRVTLWISSSSSTIRIFHFSSDSSSFLPISTSSDSCSVRNNSSESSLLFGCIGKQVFVIFEFVHNHCLKIHYLDHDDYQLCNSLCYYGNFIRNCIPFPRSPEQLILPFSFWVTRLYTMCMPNPVPTFLSVVKMVRIFCP